MCTCVFFTVLCTASELHSRFVMYIQYILTMANTFCFLQHKCDLINMSYGEATLLPDYGRFVDLVNEVSNLNFVNSLDGYFCLFFFFFCLSCSLIRYKCLLILNLGGE